MGAVMGMPPREIDAMTMWEFEACAEGYALAHGAKKDKEPRDVDDDVLRQMGIEGF